MCHRDLDTRYSLTALRILSSKDLQPAEENIFLVVAAELKQT